LKAAASRRTPWRFALRSSVPRGPASWAVIELVIERVDARVLRGTTNGRIEIDEPPHDAAGRQHKMDLHVSGHVPRRADLDRIG
jgi:hypothetical protein